MTLAEVIAAAADQVPDIASSVASRSGDVSWSVDGQVFAVLAADGTSVAILLDPVVADAAARTPDVVASGRGPGWVELRPPLVDGHVADRAAAWFRSAHRRLWRPEA